MDNLQSLLSDVNGATFISLNTATDMPLNKTIKVGTETHPNPHHGRVKKLTTGMNVMVFTNEKSNGYNNMVRRRLEKEGKDPNSFVLGKRAWGTRVEGTPIIKHNGETYLEVIVLSPGKTSYMIGNKPIDKSEIHGQKKSRKAEQGGLDVKVIVRTFKASSITQITINKQTHRA